MFEFMISLFPSITRPHNGPLLCSSSALSSRSAFARAPVCERSPATGGSPRLSSRTRRCSPGILNFDTLLMPRISLSPPPIHYLTLPEPSIHLDLIQSPYLVCVSAASLGGVSRILLSRSSPLFSAFACPSLEFRFLFYSLSLLINPKLIHIFQFLEFVCVTHTVCMFTNFLLHLPLVSPSGPIVAPIKSTFDFRHPNRPKQDNFFWLLLKSAGRAENRSPCFLAPLINLAIAESDD